MKKVNKFNVLKEDKKTKNLLLGSEIIPRTKLSKLAEEAKLLKTLEIWSIFQDSLRNYAIETGFLNATTIDQFKEGKMLEFSITYFETILATIENKNKLLNNEKPQGKIVG